MPRTLAIVASSKDELRTIIEAALEPAYLRAQNKGATALVVLRGLVRS